MAKRRTATVNNGNAPVKEQAKKAPKKVPVPPVEEEFEEDLLTDEEMDEMEAESKPSLWTRIKESKPVKFGIKVGKGMIVGLALYGGVKLGEKICSGGSSYDDDNDHEDKDSYESED